MRLLTIPLVAFLCAFPGRSQAQNRDTRLMTTAEYKSFLDSVERKLPGWEEGLRKIDPAKTNASYAAGERIVQFRDLALKELGWVREYVAKQRTKHTVSGELALERFLRGAYDEMDSVVTTEIAYGITASNLESYVPEISPLMIRVANDVTARVELLEKGTCP